LRSWTSLFSFNDNVSDIGAE
ncbi:anticodon-binding domain of tRNA family protein, partial [Chlamydia psittaci 84-8471/1]